MVSDIFNFDVQEEGDFSQGVPSLKEIALMHIRKISAICCAEFTKGYWEEKPVKVGGGIAIMKKYNPDMRAVFCNSVDFLSWIIYPTADDDFKKYIDKLEEPDDKKDWETKIEQRKETFRQINLMFERTNYFDTMSGKTERSK